MEEIWGHVNLEHFKKSIDTRDYGKETHPVRRLMLSVCVYTHTCMHTQMHAHTHTSSIWE